MSYAEYISQLILCTPAELNDPEKSLLLKIIELYNRNEGIHSRVFGLELLQALRVGDAHAAELAPPQVVAGLREPMLPAQVLDRHARIGLPEEAHDLGFRESLLHRPIPFARAGL